MANSSALNFTYTVLPSNATFPAVGGTVNAYASASGGAEGNGATTLPYVVPGSTTFYNARCAASHARGLFMLLCVGCHPSPDAQRMHAKSVVSAACSGARPCVKELACMMTTGAWPRHAAGCGAVPRAPDWGGDTFCGAGVQHDGRRGGHHEVPAGGAEGRPHPRGPGRRQLCALAVPSSALGSAALSCMAIKPVVTFCVCTTCMPC